MSDLKNDFPTTMRKSWRCINNRSENLTIQRTTITSKTYLIPKASYNNWGKPTPWDLSETSKSKIHYHIPWRGVWKAILLAPHTECFYMLPNSHTQDSTSMTYWRNAQITSTSFRKLFSNGPTIQPVAIATDIRKMYNTKLEEYRWTYQRYLWYPNLEAGQEPEEKVIKT